MLEKTKKVYRPSTKRRVTRYGRRLMEKVYGAAWFRLVNEDKLDVRFQETCPFAQASGTDDFREACRRAQMNPGDEFFQKCGMMTYHFEGRFPNARKEKWREEEIEKLNDHWKNLIALRKSLARGNSNVH